MNKCDMADPSSTQKWINYFKNNGIVAIPIDCKTGRGINKFVSSVNEVLKEKIEKQKAKGLLNPTVRVMIVGIPNVGKSTFINRISKNRKAKAEDKPGVTRGNQWFTINKGFEVLDTPGVLWPKFEDKIVGERLAFTGAVKDQIMDTELLAMRLLDFLKVEKNPIFVERFKLQNENIEEIESYELLELIGRKRGMLISGGEIDTERAAIMLLDEYRSSKLGKYTFELPEN